MRAAFLLTLVSTISLLFPPCVVAVQSNDPVSAEDAAQTIIRTRNPATKISPSHLGHPGYENLAFLYDKAVDAFILDITGHHEQAEDILDYFANKLDISGKDLNEKIDTNGIYGIVKSMNPNRRQPIKGLTNALDISSTLEQGSSLLEFSTTPGPVSFMIFAFLKVNPDKYLKYATMLGETLLSMQDNEGGIHDGDRAPERVYTEPHVDSYAAFMMLYDLTKDDLWLKAARKNQQWFYRYVFHPERRTIDQGLWSGSTNTIFALDCYSWTMSGPMGESMRLEDLRKLTDSMLRHGTVLIRLTLPDEKIKSLLLVDFTNSEDPRTITARGGLHPMGTIEWTGGTILALQKNAVRLWNGNQKVIAVAYKALAEVFLEESKKSFYTVDGKKQTFYATGQGLEVAPFGGLIPNNANGWRTPYFYSKDKKNRTIQKGGSLVGAWPFLTELRVNPFILNDPYGATYDKIPSTQTMQRQARAFLTLLARQHTFSENVPDHGPDRFVQINEPKFYNKKLWEELEKGISASKVGKSGEAKTCYRKAMGWANKVLDNPVWIRLAQQENKIKEEEIGGLIAYRWGITIEENEENRESDAAIWRYPLLNEVGLTMWSLAVIYQELGDIEKSEYWIKRIIEEVPLHQIAAVSGNGDQGRDEVIGYWNALVSWQNNPSGSKLDEKMKNSYLRVLDEENLYHFRPETIFLSNTTLYTQPGFIRRIINTPPD